ncbi:hypothetical protein FOZ62_012947 [Perkinsus olseni]|uniref:Uncharacterized protein n=1 Tax=Perkinsus olseni TaxID=32597 RepID=A0A7J6RA38_PEROL|nr:hypothetical protein FOZ62_012947 [Perkinsus olseni]
MANHDDNHPQADEATPLRISLSMPPAFDGISGSFKDWLRRYEQCALAAGWSSQQQAERLGLYLKEPFLSGWDAYAKKVNYEEDKDTLLKIFDHVRPHQALKQFQVLRWSKGQHPALYAAALQRHLRRYYTRENFPELAEDVKAKNIEQMVIDRLKSDLPPMVRFQLLLSEPRTIQDACFMCESVLSLDGVNALGTSGLPQTGIAAAAVTSNHTDESATNESGDSIRERILRLEKKLDRLLELRGLRDGSTGTDQPEGDALGNVTSSSSSR